MNGTTLFPDLTSLASHLRQELQNKKFILLYAYNGTGKTRLSTAFKDLGKKVVTEPLATEAGELIVTEDGESITAEVMQRDTLYFNAFTEDLFSWDNDLANDRERVLKINKNSAFFAGLGELEMDNRIRPLLNRYADFDFRIDTTEWEVSFSREIQNGEAFHTIDDIKVSRGEENIFIWCFFLAILQLALDGAEAYKWVKYVYVDDPISSLDENNAITVGNHLAQLLKRKDHGLKAVISSHHTLFFNVLWNELDGRRGKKHIGTYFLSYSKKANTYNLEYTGATPFFYHLFLLSQICEARTSGELYTHHFNALRGLMEKASVFHGYDSFSVCVKKNDTDPDETLYGRILNILSHGSYSFYEPAKMLPENVSHFETVLDDFLEYYPFNIGSHSGPPELETLP